MSTMQKYGDGVVIELEAKPNSREDKIENENGKIKVYVRAPAEKGKANIAIVKLFSKITKAQCQLVSGLTSKKKRLFVQINEENFNKFLVSWKI